MLKNKQTNKQNKKNQTNKQTKNTLLRSPSETKKKDDINNYHLTNSVGLYKYRFRWNLVEKIASAAGKKKC